MYQLCSRAEGGRDAENSGSPSPQCRQRAEPPVWGSRRRAPRAPRAVGWPQKAAQRSSRCCGLRVGGGRWPPPSSSLPAGERLTPRPQGWPPSLPRGARRPRAAAGSAGRRDLPRAAAGAAQGAPRTWAAAGARRATWGAERSGGTPVPAPRAGGRASIRVERARAPGSPPPSLPAGRFGAGGSPSSPLRSLTSDRPPRQPRAAPAENRSAAKPPPGAGGGAGAGGRVRAVGWGGGELKKFF